MPLVSDVMTQDVATLSPDSTIREAMELLCARHLSGAPVIVGKRVVGIVSMTDLLGFLINVPEPAGGENTGSITDEWDGPDSELDETHDIDASLGREDTWEEWSNRSDVTVDGAVFRSGDAIDEHTVDEVMTDAIVSVPPGMSVRAASTIMHKHGIHRVLVMNKESLVGILSASDVVRAVSVKGTADDSGITLRVFKGEPCVWTKEKGP